MANQAGGRLPEAPLGYNELDVHFWHFLMEIGFVLALNWLKLGLFWVKLALNWV